MHPHGLQPISRPQTCESRRGAAAAASSNQSSCRGLSVLGRPGSDLLFQALRLSTIGAGEFNGRVRDGIGYKLPANTTRPAKDRRRRTNDGGQMKKSAIVDAFRDKLVLLIGPLSCFLRRQTHCRATLDGY